VKQRIIAPIWPLLSNLYGRLLTHDLHK